MKKNNPFDVHGIGHLSHSSLNTWLQDPAKFIAEKLFLIRDKGSASMHRGTAIEFGLSQSYNDDSWQIDNTVVEQKFDQLCQDDLIDVDDYKRTKERDALKEYANQLNREFTYPNLVDYQKKIEIQFEDIPVPVIGYIDFIFEEAIVDLKTTARMPSNVTDANKRQMAIYNLAYPNLKANVCYASPKNYTKFLITEDEIKLHQKQVKALAFGLMKFLSISDDKEELASIIHPNYDMWTWSDYMKEQSSKTIQSWRYE